MFKNKKVMYGVIAVVLMLSIGAFVYSRKRKKEIDELSTDIYNAIDAKVGIDGADVDSILLSTREDTKYILSNTDADKIKSASGGLFPDHPDKVTEVLGGKTKGQIKAIVRQFPAKNGGVTFNAFLRSFLNQSEFDNILNVIRSAK